MKSVVWGVSVSDASDCDRCLQRDHGLVSSEKRPTRPEPRASWILSSTEAIRVPNPYRTPRPVSDSFPIQNCERDQCPFCLQRHSIREVLGTFNFHCKHCGSALTVGVSRRHSPIITGGFLLLLLFALAVWYTEMPVYEGGVFMPGFIWILVALRIRWTVGIIQPKRQDWLADSLKHGRGRFGKPWGEQRDEPKSR